MLMNLALDEMQGNAALSVLSGQRQRYEYFGYTSGGIQWIFTVNQSNIRHAFKKVNCDEISFVPFLVRSKKLENAFTADESVTSSLC